MFSFQRVTQKSNSGLVNKSFGENAFSFPSGSKFSLSGQLETATLVYRTKISSFGRELSNLIQFFSHFAKGIRDHMFERKEDPHSGLDLVSLNIQRSRDHALKPYVHYRRLFGLSVPHSFDDLHDTMENEPIEAFKNVYEFVKYHPIDRDETDKIRI